MANVHVTAAEVNGKVVFLHEVRDGPASQSYGLAVAQLAGVPPSVVRRARALLVQLEERSLGAQPQLDMFVSAPPPAATDDSADALREKLRSIDLDAFSPREAHALLDELQRLAAD